MKASSRSVFHRFLVDLAFSSKLMHKSRAVLSIIVAISALPFIAWTLPWHNSPEYARKQICEIKSPSDLAGHKDYMTDQGYNIVSLTVYLLKDVSFNPEFGAAVVSGKACSIPFHDSTTSGELLFMYDGNWRLDDILLTKLKGHPFHADFASITDPLRSLVNAVTETPEQIASDTTYVTEKGRKVQAKFIQGGGGDDSTSSPSYFGDPVVGTDQVQFSAMTVDGKNELRYNIVRDNGWRFDDIVFVKMGGGNINMTASYAADHPILAGFKLSWSIPMFGR